MIWADKLTVIGIFLAAMMVLIALPDGKSVSIAPRHPSNVFDQFDAPQAAPIAAQSDARAPDSTTATIELFRRAAAGDISIEAPSPAEISLASIAFMIFGIFYKIILPLWIFLRLVDWLFNGPARRRASMSPVR